MKKKNIKSKFQMEAFSRSNFNWPYFVCIKLIWPRQGWRNFFLFDSKSTWTMIHRYNFVNMKNRKKKKFYDGYKVCKYGIVNYFYSDDIRNIYCYIFRKISSKFIFFPFLFFIFPLGFFFPRETLSH